MFEVSRSEYTECSLTGLNRVRYQVSTAAPLDYASEARKLAEVIKKYNIDDNSLFVQ
jgi:hypothetical protein